MFIDAFDGLMKQTLNVQNQTGQDGYGAPTLGAATPVKCRLSYGRKLINNEAGEQAVSMAQAWCRADAAAISTGSVITLPDLSTPRVLRVDQLADEGGQPSHYQIFFA